jgi:hypothetical protein
MAQNVAKSNTESTPIHADISTLKFPPKSLVYVGKRKMRSTAESHRDKGTKGPALPPETYLHTFVDVSGLRVGRCIERGFVVAGQKSFNGLTPTQLERFRQENMRKFPRTEFPVIDANVEEGARYFVINGTAAGIGPEMTADDKLDYWRTELPEVYAQVFEPMDEKSRRINVEALWDGFVSMMANRKAGK